MEDKKILLKWFPLKNRVETKGHQMSDRGWYVYLPFDNGWHFIPNTGIEVCQ